MGQEVAVNLRPACIFFVKTADKKIHLPKPLIYCIFNDAPIHGAKHRGACPCENNPLAANYRK